MSDGDEPEESARTDSTTKSETEHDDSEKIRSSASSTDEVEFQKILAGDEGNQLAGVLSSLGFDSKIVSVYIDARSGGVFFHGNSQIGGNVTGRDYVKSDPGIASETKATVGQILVTDLRKINTVYVESLSYETVKAKLEEDYLVILHGRAHTGKWTTAVHILEKLHKGRVIELDPSAKLQQLKESIHSERGYIVDNLSIEEVENLSAFSCDPLRDQLRKSKSHLIITVDAKKRLPSHIPPAHTVFWDPVLDVNTVLAKHLDWYAPDAAVEAKKKIQSEEKVSSFLQSGLLPGEVDRLAEILGSVLSEKIELEVALAHYRTSTLEYVKDWFDENQDLDDRLLLLSVAVFNGASYQIISDAQKRLKSLFPEHENAPVSSDVFGSSRSQRIRRVRAQLKDGFTSNELGKVGVKIVELDNQNIQPAVLQYAWDEFDRLRDILVIWLRNSVVNNSFDERIRVAAAVGELCKLDFNEIRSKIILPWAKDADIAVRVSSSMALGIPAWHSESAPLVLKLLHHWSTINNWRLCWTACASYGGLAGIRFPDAALRDLQLIAKTGDLRLLGVLSQSMKNLFDAGELVPQYRQKVLDALVAWTEKIKDPEGVFGLLVFLTIAQRSWQKAETDGDEWPTLLCLVKDDKLLTGSILTLWARAFNARPSREAAFTVLEGWLRVVQKDRRLEDDSLELMKGIANQEDKGKEGRMKSYLTRWKMKPETEYIAAWILDRM